MATLDDKLPHVHVALCRFIAEEAFSFRMRELAPDALRILDMQDFHTLRNGACSLALHAAYFTLICWSLSGGSATSMLQGAEVMQPGCQGGRGCWRREAASQKFWRTAQTRAAPACSGSWPPSTGA